MGQIARRLVLVAFVGSMITVWSASNDRSIVMAQKRTPVNLTRIYTGPDGQTHAEQIDVAFAPNLLYASPPGFVQDWHPAAARRYLVTLSGRGEVELGGGKKIPLEPGRILLAEDLTGRGHISRAVGSVDRVSLFITLADSAKTP